MKGPEFEKIRDTEVDNLIKASDILVNSESGLSLVVIKPDAYKHREQIIRRFENSGLGVVSVHSVKLPDRFVSDVMYKDLPSGIKEETLKHFSIGPAEIILLKGGENVVQKIVSITGQKTNPLECDIGTIRYEFGEHFGRKTEDGKIYFRNAVHRGKDSKEQKEDLDKFKGLY